MTTCDGNDRPGLWSPHDSAAVLVATPGGAATGQAVEGAAQNVPPDAFGSDVDVGQREGDTGAGRCRIPAVGEPLTEENRRRIEQARERAKEMERQRMEELASVTAAFRPAALITGSFLVCTLMALSALLGLFVLAQVTSTLAALASFPAWAQVLGWAGLLVLVGALTWVAGRFCLFYFRLKANRPLVLAGLAEMSERALIAGLVHEKKAEAQAQLADYLEAYPLDSVADRRALVGIGLLEGDFKEMMAGRTDLLNPNRFADFDQWFRDYKARFQERLDRAANDRIAYWAKRVAVAAAASPNALVDVLLMSYGSFAMLTDLCKIYHLRVGRLGTAVLLFRVFGSVYLSGQVFEFEKSAESGIENLFDDSGVRLWADAALGATVAKMAETVSAKFATRAAAGALNYFLLKRLGIRARDLLRPLR